MDHAEIKSELNKRRLVKSSIEKNLQTTLTTIADLNEKYSAIEQSLDSRKQERKEHMREQVLKASSADLEKEITIYEDELSALRMEQKAELDHYSFDKIKLNFFKNSPLSESTLSDIQVLKEESYDTVSERFVQAYFISLGKCRVSEDDFLTALENLPKAGEEFFRQRDNKLNMIINGLISRIKEIDIDSSSDQGQMSATVLGGGVLVLILSFLIFPFYSVGLCLVTFLNFYESKAMKYSLDFLKVIEDNYKLMESALIRRATEEYQTKQDEINEKFSEAMAIVQQDVDEVNNEISRVRQKALAEFVFDGSGVEAEVNSELSTVKHQIQDQERTEKEIKQKLSEINDEIAKLMQQYNDSLGSLETNYIDFTRVGSSKFYPDRILLEAGDPPEFFKNPGRSTFFIYKDKPSIINFIKLVCLQLRCNVSPSCSNVEIWDIEESGVYFTAFRNVSAKGGDCGFTVINTSEGLKESVGALETILQKRLKSIRISYDNINDYNKDMVQLNSVTENYYTLFVLSPDPLLRDESFKRLLVNGPDLGIYVHIFVDYARLGEMHIEVLERVNTCVLAQSGKFATNAVDAVINRIIASKNQK